MGPMDEEPSWIQKAVEWYALPSEQRQPKGVLEFIATLGVPVSTFYKKTSTKEFDQRVVELSLSSAKKHTPDVLEALRIRAVEQGNVLAQINFLKLVVQLAERFSHEEKQTFENRTIIELVDRTAKDLTKKGVNVDNILQSITGQLEGSGDTSDAPDES